MAKGGHNPYMLAIRASRQEHLRPWERFVLYLMPKRVYHQVLREHDLVMEALR